MKKFSPKAWLAWAVLGVGLVTTAWLGLQMKRNAESDAVSQFAYASDQITLKIRERLAAQELILRGGAGLLTGADQVDRKAWRLYWETLKPEMLVPGVQGFGFSLLIPHDKLDAHTKGVRREGFPEYAVRPAGKRDVYTAIIYLEPFSGRNLRAFGYDMFAEPVRREAMVQARDTGHSTLSGKVELVQETGQDVQSGVLMYTPVYRQGMPTETVAQRQAALVGWSYSPYRMSDLMSGMLLDWQDRLGKEIHIDVYDGPQATPASQLYSSKSDEVDHARSLFYQQRLIDFNGHVWLLAFDREPNVGNVVYTPAWLTVVGGLLISALLFWLLRTLLNTSLQASRIAERLTYDIQQQAQLLKDSVFRWNFALDGSDLGVWDWDIAEGTVFFSKRWKQLLGYADNEIGNSFDDWDSRLHPDDKPAIFSALQAYMEGRSPNYDIEHRILCKDGNYKWIRDRGTIITRSEEGKPLRMIGTISDITEQKRDVMRIQLLARLNAAMSECNAAIVHCTSQNELFARVCKVVVQSGGMKMCWIGLADPVTERIAPVSAYGDGTDYLHGINISVRGDDPHGQGATGTAVREDHPVWIEDFRTDPRAAPWRERAASYGWVSSAALPIRRAGQPVGALTFYSAEAGWYDHETRAIFASMVAEISFALDKLDSEAKVRASQASLLEAGKRLQKVFEAAPVPMQIHASADLRISFINQTYQHWLGYSLEEISSVDQWLSKVFGSGEAREQASAFLHQSLTQVRAGMTVHAPEFTLHCKDGSVRIGQCTMTTVGEDIVGAWTDLTDIRRSEQALRDSEQRFRGMVEQTNSGIYVRRDGRFVYANPRFCEMTGYRSEELLGQDVLQFIPGTAEDFEHIRQAWAALQTGLKTSVSYSVPLRRKDGRVIELELHTKSITWDDGLPATIVMTNDITERKRAEEQIAHYVKQLEGSMEATLQAVSNMVELRDPYTAGHERRVGLIAGAIAREMGWTAQQCKELELVGLVHDIGKIAVPAEILCKPGRLTNLEMALVREHAQAGYDILKDVPFGSPVAEIIRQHHERIDGSGYPRGLKGDEILPEARILAVADVIESMAAHRPYRPALGLDAALAEVERGNGTLYDREVADAVIRLVREKNYVLPE